VLLKTGFERRNRTLHESQIRIFTLNDFAKLREFNGFD
jgi:hypothetical protein